MTKKKQLIELIILVTFIHALFSVIIFPKLKKVEKIYTEDRDKYSIIATNITEGKGYVLMPGPHSTMKRLPLYPIFLAIIYKTLGKSNFSILIVQFFLVVLSMVFTYSVSTRIHHMAGIFSSAFIGLYPLVILYTPRHYSEILTMFLITSSIWVFTKYYEKKQKAWFVLFVFNISLVWLSRSSLVLFVVVVFFVLLIDKRFHNKRFIFLSGLSIFFLTIAPWVVRNYRVSGHIVIGSTWNSRAALNGLYIMTNKDAEIRPRLLDQAYSLKFNKKIQMILGPINSPQLEIAQSKYAYRFILDFLKNHFTAYVLSIWRGFFRIIFLTSSRPMRIIVGIVNLFFIFTIVSAFYFEEKLLQKDVTLLYILIILFTIPLFYIPVFPVVRYILPSIPAFAILSGIGSADLLMKIMGKKRFEKFIEKI